MIPAFEKFFYPILKHIEDGKQYSLKDLRNFCADHFSLTEDDLAEKIKSGHSRLYDRVQWTMAYFYQAEIVDRIKRGLYQINSNGKALLSKGITDLSVNYLKEYSPAFLAFSQKSNKPSNAKNPAQAKQEESPDDLKTPIDIIDENFQIVNQELAEELLQQVKSQSPKFFEHLVIELLVKMGYGGQFDDGAFVTQASHDEGIDGIIKEDKLGLDKNLCPGQAMGHW